MKVVLILTIFVAYLGYTESSETKCFPVVTGNCRQVIRAYRDTINGFIQNFRQIFQKIKRVARRSGRLTNCTERKFNRCRNLEARADRREARMENRKNRLQALLNRENKPRNYEQRVTRIINRVQTLIGRIRNIEDRRQRHNCDAPCVDRLVEIRALVQEIYDALMYWVGEVQRFMDFKPENLRCYERFIRRLFNIFKQAVENYAEASASLRATFTWTNILPEEAADRWSHDDEDTAAQGDLNGVAVLLQNFSGYMSGDLDTVLSELYSYSADEGSWNEGFAEEKQFFEEVLAMDDLDDALKAEVQDILNEIGEGEA
ncbi:CLUMA_CG002484, isoform A [Clunio marinus]|uniref:CLUMA_CG002484, isoform A n=1 Tax=Clunio marinus TaxID=568069 RepID=A0A1J1HRC2_9DIPT|nr:CLUMA_CG002484, isoform A [Clunio marinus]